MIFINEAIVRNLIVHKLVVSRDTITLNDRSLKLGEQEDEDVTLNRILLKPFTSTTSTYEFAHNIDIDLNPLFKLSKDIYEGSDFTNVSRDIVTHLMTSSRHPGIKDGDVFIAKFDDIRIDDTYYQGIGIYKYESKERYVEIIGNDKNMGIQLRQGIGSKKPEKACLILFTDERFTVLSMESGSIETEYWTRDFLNIEPKRDYRNNTGHILNITKSFVTEKFTQDHAASRADQIDLLNRSVKYFKNNDTFSTEKFEKEVLKDEGVIDSFRNFNTAYTEEKKLEWKDNFTISQDVVKKQARVFKSVLKLDKNFDIYIHGDKNLIERGVEKDGRKFYKIYYSHEM